MFSFLRLALVMASLCSNRTVTKTLWWYVFCYDKTPWLSHLWCKRCTSAYTLCLLTKVRLNGNSKQESRHMNRSKDHEGHYASTSWTGAIHISHLSRKCSPAPVLPTGQLMEAFFSTELPSPNGATVFPVTKAKGKRMRLRKRHSKRETLEK